MPAVLRCGYHALRELNQVHFQSVRDPAIASRIVSYELAFRLQAAPELIDLRGERSTRWIATVLTARIRKSKLSVVAVRINTEASRPIVC